MNVQIRVRDVVVAVLLETAANLVDLGSATTLAINTFDIHATELNFFDAATDDPWNHLLLKLTTRSKVRAKQNNAGICYKIRAAIAVLRGLEAVIGLLSATGSRFATEPCPWR